MLCTICKRKFNRESSYYRHLWSDKHLLKQQILEFEKEIKTLEQTISQYQNISETLPIPVLEKAVTYA
jgi:prefoldin subunit 5